MTQNESIARYLARGKTLTALSAFRLFGCLRLAARVDELQRKGFRIKSEMIAVTGKRVARYKFGG